MNWFKFYILKCMMRCMSRHVLKAHRIVCLIRYWYPEGVYPHLTPAQRVEFKALEEASYAMLDKEDEYYARR